jgi:hypothetical protein
VLSRRLCASTADNCLGLICFVPCLTLERTPPHHISIHVLLSYNTLYTRLLLQTENAGAVKLPSERLAAHTPCIEAAAALHLLIWTSTKTLSTICVQVLLSSPVNQHNSQPQAAWQWHDCRPSGTTQLGQRQVGAPAVRSPCSKDLRAVQDMCPQHRQQQQLVWLS